MLVRAFTPSLAHETAGAASTRHSLLPLLSEKGISANLGRKSRGENAKLYQPSLRAQRSNPWCRKKEEWIASLRSQ
jgi:hypothetical protein